MGLVVTLKTQPERKKEDIASLLADLTAAHERGEVDSVLWAYRTSDGEVVTGVSEHMLLGQFAYVVAVLQERLMRWISES